MYVSITITTNQKPKKKKRIDSRKTRRMKKKTMNENNLEHEGISVDATLLGTNYTPNILFQC